MKLVAIVLDQFAIVILCCGMWGLTLSLCLDLASSHRNGSSVR